VVVLHTHVRAAAAAAACVCRTEGVVARRLAPRGDANEDAFSLAACA